MKPIVDQAFWSDPAIEASESGIKLAALWLMTNSQTTLLGICSATPNRFQFETGLPASILEATLQTLPHIFQRFGQAIFIRSYMHGQFGTGEKLVRNNFFAGLKSLFGAVKDPALKAAILSEYPEFSILALPRASEGLPKPKDEKDDRDRKDKDVQDGAEPNARKEIRPGIVHPSKPTREEARAYGRELGMDALEVDCWYDYFESNGWQVSGTTPMHDWRASLRNGSRRKGEFRSRPSEEPGTRGKDGGQDGLRLQHLLTEWPQWLKARGQPFVEYRRAPDFLKSDFHQERKAKPTHATV